MPFEGKRLLPAQENENLRLEYSNLYGSPEFSPAVTRSGSQKALLRASISFPFRVKISDGVKSVMKVTAVNRCHLQVHHVFILGCWHGIFAAVLMEYTNPLPSAAFREEF
jgi:hypothetical protein